MFFKRKPKTQKEMIVSVVGMVYHEKDVNKLRIKRKDYKTSAAIMEKIWKYDWPTGPVVLSADSMGAKVTIAKRHVGYVSQESSARVLGLLKKKAIVSADATITGGTYKVVSRNGDAVEMDESVRIKLRIVYVEN